MSKKNQNTETTEAKATKKRSRTPAWAKDEPDATVTVTETKPGKTVETKPKKLSEVKVPATEKKPAPEVEKKAKLADLTIKSDPNFKVRVGSIQYALQSAFEKPRKVSEGIEDMLSSGFSAPRSAIFNNDPTKFVRDYIKPMLNKGLLIEVG